MVGTRSTLENCSPTVDAPPKSDKLIKELKKLEAGGSGGRLHSCCIGSDNSKAKLRSQWKFCTSTKNEMRPSCAATETPASTIDGESPLSSTPKDCPLHKPENIIMNADNLKNCIEENYICRKCARTSFYSSLSKVLSYLATELDLSPCQSVAGSYMGLVRSLAKEGKSLYEEDTLKVRFISEGLATTMHANCTQRRK